MEIKTNELTSETEFREFKGKTLYLYKEVFANSCTMKIWTNKNKTLFYVGSCTSTSRKLITGWNSTYENYIREFENLSLEWKLHNTIKGSYF